MDLLLFALTLGSGLGWFAHVFAQSHSHQIHRTEPLGRDEYLRRRDHLVRDYRIVLLVGGLVALVRFAFVRAPFR